MKVQRGSPFGNSLVHATQGNSAKLSTSPQDKIRSSVLHSKIITAYLLLSLADCNNLPDLVDDPHASGGDHVAIAVPWLAFAALQTVHASPAADVLQTWVVGVLPEGLWDMGYQTQGVSAFRAREVADLAMGWEWHLGGKEIVPGGDQLLADPKDAWVQLNLGVVGPADAGVGVSVCASAGDDEE